MGALAYIALGSNLGDRRDYLDRAVAALRGYPAIRVVAVSLYHETEPVGGPTGQGAYLNAAAKLETELTPRALLEVLHEVEQQLGRVRRERFGPRTIDLDLLLYENLVLDEGNLNLPHPRLHERLFVLEPMAEIAPNAFHPTAQATVSELLAKVRGASQLPVRGGIKDLSGLHALVTGSSSGIGKAIALALADGGADVIVHRRGARAGAAAVADEVAALGQRTSILLADLRDPVACDHLVQEAWRMWKGIDIWINNAGADVLTGEAVHWSFERKLEELLAVDLKATMRLSRAIGACMVERGRGVILNMGWDQAETGMEGASGELFAAVKGGIMAFTRSLARSLAPLVRVNCVAPGWIRTAWGTHAGTQWQDRVLRETLLHRWGKPEDVAATVRWLASPAAAYMTGQIIKVNGGAV